jgi:hypothetical protein
MISAADMINASGERWGSAKRLKPLARAVGHPRRTEGLPSRWRCEAIGLASIANVRRYFRSSWYSSSTLTAQIGALSAEPARIASTAAFADSIEWSWLL